jgi:hypothetical protein
MIDATRQAYSPRAPASQPPWFPPGAEIMARSSAAIFCSSVGLRGYAPSKCSGRGCILISVSINLSHSLSKWLQVLHE